jgi:hypothetical protein
MGNIMFPGSWHTMCGWRCGIGISHSGNIVVILSSV